METVVTINEDGLEIETQLRIFLDKNFDFVYSYNGFFIVANNDIPKNTKDDTTGENMWLKIIEYVRELMINPESPDAKKFYNKLSSNFILAYGTNTFLNEMYPIVLEKFHRQIIPIYNTSKLDYTYLNNDIIIQKLDDITWKSYGFNKKYNEIIEIILKIIFNTLNLVYPIDWSFEKLNNLYIILNRDVENGYYIPKYYNVSKAIKNYIYQVWLLIIHKHSQILSPEQKKIEELLYKYKDKGIPFTISNNITSGFNIDISIINEKKNKSRIEIFFNNLSIKLLFILLGIFIIIFILLILKIYDIF